MGQPSQNGPLTVQPFRSLLLDIMKAPFVVPTSIVTPSWFIAVALRLLDHALSYMSCTRATAALCSRARLQQKSRPPPSSLCAISQPPQRPSISGDHKTLQRVRVTFSSLNFHLAADFISQVLLQIDLVRKET